MVGTLPGAFAGSSYGPPFRVWDRAATGRRARVERPRKTLGSRCISAAGTWGLCAGSLLGSFVVAELALGAAPITRQRVLTPSGRAASLDCYPSNPRGYFDLDLRDPALQERFKALDVRRARDCAAEAPHAVELRYNSLEFRDREPPPRRAGVRRVIVLGDSFTEGQGVKEPDVYPRVLERALNAQGTGRWEVLNFGHRGADFPGLRDTFERLLEFEPDIVVYGMMLNDGQQSPGFRARHPHLSLLLTGRGRRRDSAHGGGFGLRTASFVHQRLERVRLRRETTAWYEELYAEPNREGWRLTQEHMREMHRRMRGRGGHFLVATWPVLTDLDGEYPLRKVHETVGQFCHREGIAWLDLLPALQGRPASVLWVHPLDPHPNEIAHRLVAFRLTPAVRDAVRNGG